MAAAVHAESDRAPDSSVTFPGEEYECKICYNYFDLDCHVPKILECSHTFCRQCLDTLHGREGRGWRIGCPLCRHRTPVPEYRVCNLPDDAAITQALPEKLLSLSEESVPPPQFGVPAAGSGPEVSAVTAVTVEESRDGEDGCKHFAFTTGCVCAIFSFLSMLALLFLGIVFIHNFNTAQSSFGSLCLFGASVFALISLVLTWLLCLLKYRAETGISLSFPSVYYPM